MQGIENRILRLIADGASLTETAAQICLEVERASPGAICSVVNVCRAGLLHPLAAPSLAPEYCARMEGVMIGPEVGSCGVAAYTRKPVLVTDISADPKWTRYCAFPTSLGLKACWSAPVIDDGEPIGALAVFFPEARGPCDDELAVFASCVDLCAIALRRHERALERERRASVDALTTLPNRAAFNIALKSLACDDPGSWGLFVVDLDNLKIVNDTFGHRAGDGLLQTASARIAAAVSPDVTFRLGGDEFAVIIRRPEALADLDETAHRILEALRAPADCDGNAIVPSGTVGGAVVATGDESAEAVYKNADFALYHAKETGRGGFVRFWPGIDTRIVNRQATIKDVSAALGEGRIDAHYQPVMRLDTGEIVGIEALCRLRKPNGEIVPAARFRDATSDARVAVELTSRMLDVVARDVRHWIDLGIPFQHVGVNVSTADFYSGDLLSKLETSFGRVGVPLSHIIIEVSENVSIGCRNRDVDRVVERLRASGIRVALDDFGTGHASLTHLLNVPVDAIKIDQTFVARLKRHDASLAIVQGIIDIARKLDIRVIAEGIETEAQAEQLVSMGCRLGQGFLFSAAVDRDSMTEMLLRRAQGMAEFIPMFYEQPPGAEQIFDAVTETELARSA